MIKTRQIDALKVETVCSCLKNTDSNINKEGLERTSQDEIAWKGSNEQDSDDGKLSPGQKSIFARNYLQYSIQL